MIAEVLMIKLTEGEKAEKQKAKGMTLEKIWFWKVEHETKKEILEGREWTVPGTLEKLQDSLL